MDVKICPKCGKGMTRHLTECLGATRYLWICSCGYSAEQCVTGASARPAKGPSGNFRVSDSAGDIQAAIVELRACIRSADYTDSDYVDGVSRKTLSVCLDVLENR